jgi:hypothetical protein
MTDALYPEIKVALTGEDGNVFSIIGRCRRAVRLWARKNDVDPEPIIDAFTKDATSGNYDHALQTVMRYFTWR